MSTFLIVATLISFISLVVGIVFMIKHWERPEEGFYWFIALASIGFVGLMICAIVWWRSVEIRKEEEEQVEHKESKLIFPEDTFHLITRYLKSVETSLDNYGMIPEDQTAKRERYWNAVKRHLKEFLDIVNRYNDRFTPEQKSVIYARVKLVVGKYGEFKKSITRSVG